MMKKLLQAAGCLLLLPLTACSVQSGSTENTMNGQFTAQVRIRSGEEGSTATLTRYGSDAWCVVFEEPAALSGVQLDFLDEEVKASYKGLEFSVPQSAQAVRTQLSELMQVVDGMALSPTLEGEMREEVLTLEGSTDAGSYTLVCSPDGIPQSFSLPSYALEVEFEGFTPLAGEVQTETETEGETGAET